MKPFWWLSFAKAGRGFLGVAIVRADSMPDAMEKAWRLGINPGGEVEGVQIPPNETVPDDCVNRLLQADELVGRGLSDGPTRVRRGR